MVHARLHGEYGVQNSSLPLSAEEFGSRDAVSVGELAKRSQRRCARDLKSTASFTPMSRGVQQPARLRMRDDAAGSSQSH
jgi:hypothetical protein